MAAKRTRNVSRHGRSARWPAVLAVALVVVGLSAAGALVYLASTGGASTAALAPTIATDQADYAPGSTVTSPVSAGVPASPCIWS